MVKKNIYGYDFLITFKLIPPVKEWKLENRKVENKVVKEKYSEDNYYLDTELTFNEHITVISFCLRRKNKEEFLVEENKIQCNIPNIGVHRIWTPSLIEELGQKQIVALPWFLDDKVASHRSMPLICIMDRIGKVKFALGFIDQRIETSLSSRVYKEPDYTFFDTFVEIKRPFGGIKLKRARYQDAIFISKGLPWFDTVQEFVNCHDKIMGYSISKPPDYVYDPVWNTWSAGETIDDINEENVLANAEIASKLGFKNIIIDAGWFCETGKWYPEQCGDYVVNEQKFPDMRDLVKKLRKLGLRVILWCAPFVVGEESQARRIFRGSLIETEEVDDPVGRIKDVSFMSNFLCPRNPITQKHVPELVARIIKNYNLDGVKLDFIDFVPLLPCVAKHEHNFDSVGVAMDYCLRRIREEVDKVKPGALIEFRQQYANINNRAYANAFRAIDCPLDPDQNRMLCTFLRSFSKGVAVYTDYIWWHPKESLENIAKTIATAIMAGVPTFAVNLRNVPQEHLGIIKNWLKFYEQHREDLIYGNYIPVQSDSYFSTILINSGKRLYVELTPFSSSIVPLPQKAREILVLNCTDKDFIFVVFPQQDGIFEAEIYNQRFKKTKKITIQSKGGKLLLEAPVPQGGHVILTKVNNC